MRTIRSLAFAGLSVIALASAATAAPVGAVSTHQIREPYAALSQMAHYGHSGSIGRLNYGASPMHPEGPGNFSD